MQISGINSTVLPGRANERLYRARRGVCSRGHFFARSNQDLVQFFHTVLSSAFSLTLVLLLSTTQYMTEHPVSSGSREGTLKPIVVVRLLLKRYQLLNYCASDCSVEMAAKMYYFQESSHLIRGK